MARRKGISLTRNDVIAAALALVEESGPAALNLHAVATRLGIRTPSLYNHVDGFDDLQQAMALEIGQMALAEVVWQPGDGPAESLRSLARAFRRFAQRRGNLFNQLMMSPVNWRQPPFAAMWALLFGRAEHGVLGFEINPADQTHAVHYVFATISGFIRLELRGAMADEAAADQSFEWVLDRVITALESQRPKETPAPG